MTAISSVHQLFSIFAINRLGRRRKSHDLKGEIKSYFKKQNIIHYRKLSELIINS